MKRRTFLKTVSLAAIESARLQSAQTLRDWSLELQALDENQFWENVISQFQLAPEITHLNGGSIGACPKIVSDTLIQLTREIERDPYNNFWGDGLCQQLESVRETAARFINATVDEIAITRNTTEGMNLIARGLDLNPGDEILTSNREHPGGIACWNYLSKRIGIKISFVRFPSIVRNESEIMGLIKNAVTPKTKVLSFCHVDTMTGMVLPVEQISKLAKQKNLFFACDGAQAPGMLSVDAKKLGVDAYASSSHKWALAPKGSGLLYIAKSSQHRVNSLELSTGFNVYTASGGTRDIAQILAHGTAIKFHETIGINKIANRIQTLNNYLSKKLIGLDSLSRLTPPQPNLTSGMVTFRIDPELAASAQVADELRRKYKIYVKAVPPTYGLVADQTLTPEDYNAIRFSTHIFNSEKQIDHAVNCFARVLDTF